jgi:AcrR family transcriptional regulator
LNTKARIERVATRQFALYGFDGTSVRQIVAAAKVTKPVLYYYFKDKRNLYLGLLEQAIAPLCDEIERIAGGASHPPGRMEEVIAAFLQFFRESSDQFQLLHRAVERREREVQIIAQKYFRRIFDAISRILSDGIAQGSFKTLNVTQGTFSIIAILVYYCTRAHVIDEILGQRRATAALMESLHRHILGLLEV